MNGKSRPKGAAPKTPATASDHIVGQLELGEEPDIPPGLAQAEANASAWWWSPAMLAMKWMADTGQPFECWDLTSLGVPDPSSPAHWGALFNAAAQAGLIQHHGYTRSRRPGRASGLTRTWTGVR